jgi:hypothetical protein
VSVNQSRLSFPTPLDTTKQDFGDRALSLLFDQIYELLEEI